MIFNASYFKKKEEHTHKQSKKYVVRSTEYAYTTHEI